MRFDFSSLPLSLFDVYQDTASISFNVFNLYDSEMKG